MILIYIIAFNKPELIEEQILFLKKYLVDNYRLLIVDNSNILSKSLEIERICDNNMVSYIKLPMNKLTASHSHWLSLNYIMKHIITKSKTQYIWFLDHDCFLVKKQSIVNILKKQDMWWLLIDDVPLKIWNNVYNMAWTRRFLRPWCSFYKRSLFDKWYNFFPVKRFFPISFLDTWWWNWNYVYKFYRKEKLNLLKRYRDNNIQGAENIWNTFIHLWWAGYKDKDQIKGIFNSLVLYYLDQ